MLYGIDPQAQQIVASPQLDRVRTEPAVFLSGGGGLISTAADYRRFTSMLLSGGQMDGVRLLAPRTIDLMRVNHLPGGGLTTPPVGRGLTGWGDEEGGFGLGFSPLVDRVMAKWIAPAGEYSWGGAAGTAFWVDPVNELTVVFCTQVLFARHDLGYMLRQMVYQSLVD
jgi:CubicO group peptidase (beta-lactamase class C family)